MNMMMTETSNRQNIDLLKLPCIRGYRIKKEMSPAISFVGLILFIAGITAALAKGRRNGHIQYSLLGCGRQCLCLSVRQVQS